MPIIAPKQRVDAPAASPLPGGLFSQFSPIEDSSVRWENGVTWEDVERDQLGAIGQWQSPGAVPGLPKTLTNPKGLALESQLPLTVYAAFRTTVPAPFLYPAISLLPDGVASDCDVIHLYL